MIEKIKIKIMILFDILYVLLNESHSDEYGNHYDKHEGYTK